MSEAEAIKAYKEMLPVETKGYDYNYGGIARFEMPLGIIYERNGALMEEIFLKLPNGVRSVVIMPITKLVLSEERPEGVKVIEKKLFG